jgi:cytochrome c peroxidase
VRLAISLVGFGCAASPPTDHHEVFYSESLGAALTHVDGVLAALPDTPPAPDLRVSLGARLFQDVRLSEDEKVACATCHNLALGGANAQPRSDLPGRAPVPVNVPTVFNLAYDFRYAWSGKFTDVGAQIDTALGLKEAMGTNWKSAFSRVRRDSTYQADFRRAYPEGLTSGTLRDALIRYNMSLVTPGARFDQFLRGQLSLSDQEQRGYDMFRQYGCVSCHQGVNIGGNMFQRFGVMRDYFSERGEVKKADLGLYNTTQREEDRHVFRVPSLRNVALTAPYFHDGSAATLLEAVQTMARYQLGRELTHLQAVDIVAFLVTLTGRVPEVP